MKVETLTFNLADGMSDSSKSSALLKEDPNTVTDGTGLILHQYVFLVQQTGENASVDQKTTKEEVAETSKHQLSDQKSLRSNLTHYSDSKTSVESFTEVEEQPNYEDWVVRVQIYQTDNTSRN